jgi:hypothetical protein
MSSTDKYSNTPTRFLGCTDQSNMCAQTGSRSPALKIEKHVLLDVRTRLCVTHAEHEGQSQDEDLMHAVHRFGERLRMETLNGPGAGPRLRSGPSAHHNPSLLNILS